MVPQLNDHVIYGLQNGKNGDYLRYYRENSEDYDGDKPDGVNLVIEEPDESMRIKSYQIVVDYPEVGGDEFTLQTHDGRYIITRHKANGDNDVIASNKMGTESDLRAQWVLKKGNFRTDDEFYLLRNAADPNVYLYCTGQNTLWLWGGGKHASGAKPAHHWRFVSLGTMSSAALTMDLTQDKYRKLMINQTQFMQRTEEEEDSDE